MRPSLLAAFAGTLVLLAVAATPAVAAVSPTATLAYVVYPKPTSQPQLWAAKADGSAPHQLATKATSPVVSPDGTQVAYATTPANGQPDLKVVPAAGGTPRTVVKSIAAGGGGATAWSPDGTHMLTVAGPEIGKQKLLLVDVASGTSKQVSAGYFSGASFSPDGTQFVYSQTNAQYGQSVQGDLYAGFVAVGSPAPAKITKTGRDVSPLWGPNAIVYTHVVKSTHKGGDSPKANLWLVGGDGRNAHALTKLKIPFLLYGLSPVAFSASGGQLAAEYGGQDFSEGYTVDPATGKARGLSTKKLQVDAFGISRDGSTILGATGGYDPGNVHDVVTTPYAGGPVKVLVKKAWSPSWSA
jgi:Tol biopolymer transport system component